MDQQPRGSLEMLPLDVKPNDPLLREPPTIRRATRTQNGERKRNRLDSDHPRGTEREVNLRIRLQEIPR